MGGADALSAAISWAGHLRAVRSTVCESLQSSSETLEGVLARREDPAVGAVHLLTVLESLPGARKIDTRRSLAQAGLVERTSIGSLSAQDVDSVLRRFSADVGGKGP